MNRNEYIRDWKRKNRHKSILYQRERKRARKLEAIQLLGGECVDCKGTFHPAVYEFHHKDPLEKEFDPSKVMHRSYDVFIKEILKCELLCANCHRIRHHEYER